MKIYYGNANIDMLNGLFLLFIGSLFAILNSFKYFYGDDYALIYKNIIDSPNILMQYFTRGEEALFVFYRPLTNLFYGVNNLIFGPHPFGYYLFNILLYIGGLFILYKMVELLFHNKTIALISNVLFLIYFPANSGTISMICNLATALFVFFYMLSFYLYLAAKPSSNNMRSILLLILSIIVFALGLLSKEGMITLVALIIIYDLIYDRISMTRLTYYARLFPYFIVIYINMVIRSYVGVLSPFDPKVIGYSYHFSAYNVSNLLYYSAFLFIPFFTLLFFIYACDRLFNKGGFSSPDFRIIVFGLFWTFINMAPYILLDWRQLGWMYLSSFGVTFPLAHYIYVVFGNLYSRNRLLFWRSISSFFILFAVVFVIFCITFLPSKYIRRIIIDGYARQLFKEIRLIHPTITPKTNIYFLDETKDIYDLNNIFTSASIVSAFGLVYDGEAPRSVTIIKMPQLNGIPFDNNNIYFIYRAHKIFNYKRQ